MKAVGCMATYDKRANTRGASINSIINQLDSLYVIDNSAATKDRADNAKFSVLDSIQEHCYVFLLDDDLIYPGNYIENTINFIEYYGCIVTYHGRKLLGENLNYYRGHKSFHCLNNVTTDQAIDVCGTGVTAFSTKYFHPLNLKDAPDLRMSDLVFSLEAAKQKKQIGLLSHEAGWIKHIDNKETIFGSESHKCKRQNEIANEIYKLNLI